MSFTFHVEGYEPFTDKARFDQIIVEAIRRIPETDRRPTRAILSQTFGRPWSGEKLKRPIFNLARGGHLVCMGAGRYVVSPECSVPPPACPVPPKAVMTVGDTGSFLQIDRALPVYSPGEVEDTFVPGCPDWQPDRPYDFRNLTVWRGAVRDLEDVRDEGEEPEDSFTALVIHPYEP